jgi:predicted nucleic-acid-binding Zn-ribbon protein
MRQSMAYRILPQQRIAAKKLGVVIMPSKVKDKKIDVYKNGFRVATIGDIRYSDYYNYLKAEKKGIFDKGTANERRRLYRARHAGENLERGSAGYYAWYILW